MFLRKVQSGILLFLCVSLQAQAIDTFKAHQQCMRDAVALLESVSGPASMVMPARYDEGPSQFMLSIRDMPWTSSYFPMDKKGIAVRWQNQAPILSEEFADPKVLGAEDSRTVLDRLKSLTPEQINGFSAVEKFDILNGNYDFRATQTELRVRGPDRPNPPAWWEGFCNGVCAASINLREPLRPVALKNPDGIVVTFQPNDIKALASASYYFVEKYAAVGSPNRSELRINFEPLPNPGVLDWALTHYLGELHKPFAADKDPGAEIWNHVVVGYTRHLLNLEPAEKGLPTKVKWTIYANVTMTYTGGGISHEMANQPTAPVIAGGHMIEVRTYVYQLFLDQNKRIIGGRWPADIRDAPNFLWFPAGRGTDSTEGLNPLIDFDIVLDLVKRSS